MKTKNHNKTISQIGEFSLINRINALLRDKGVAAPDDMRLGIGDDCAVISPGRDCDMVVTCDSMIENKHYLPSCMTPRMTGRRAMVQNLSDIGAMGAIPRFSFVALSLPGDVGVCWVEELYLGFLDELNPLAAVIAGGNITSTDGPVAITITLTGEVEKGKAIKRNNAGPGDVILVTGYPGRAAAGLKILTDNVKYEYVKPFIDAYCAPRHRVTEGVAAAKTSFLTSMIDISDGFVSDLRHLCKNSGVGAKLFENKISFDAKLEVLSKSLNIPKNEMFLGPSDDYELIMTCAAEHSNQVIKAISLVSDVVVNEVGVITSNREELAIVDNRGAEQSISVSGWDHFLTNAR